MFNNNFLYYLLKISYKRILLTFIILLLLNSAVFYNNTINSAIDISFMKIFLNILGGPTSFITVCVFLLSLNSLHFSNYVIPRFNKRTIFFSFIIKLILLRTILFLVLAVLSTLLTALLLSPGTFLKTIIYTNGTIGLQLVCLLLGWVMVLLIIQLVILIFELKFPRYGMLIGSVIVLLILFNDMYDYFSIIFVQAISSTFYDKLYLLFIIVFTSLICLKLSKSFQILRR
ncbi:hypothetical protein CRH11_03890 [Bacillus velezensis]|uniref:Uncharacterized protein n=1 Tax=Bacillus velezensis TaxID=492670 RepID=A0A1D9PQ50_BACVE|nr:hypothetical protein BK055_19655 [Bacillus velezensis]MBG9463050.1 hypothetical protein [Bacillus amyloliquefaciens]ATO09218.1 hypothetical protein CRH11_03890 [Bacillus velezensis]AVB09526.1 hypothetical protein C3438_08215 [Bacillus velezensis]AXS62674.1 hypothetical protein CK238_19230 [Bacillus velezensis]